MTKKIASKKAMIVDDGMTLKKKTSTPSSSTLDDAQTEKAVTALLKHVALEKAKKSKETLLDDDNQVIHMTIAIKTIPLKSRVKPIRIPLKYSLLDETAEVCLITKDPHQSYKELIKEQAIPRVTKVIGLSKLRSKFKPYEAKRNLCGAYDMFLADDRILPMLPRVLGKKFFERKKLPAPVKLSKKGSIKQEIEKAIRATYYYVVSGPSSTIQVGHSGQTASQITENIMMATEALSNHVQKGWSNIQSIHIKTSESIALPIYTCLPSRSNPPLPSPPQKDSNETLKARNLKKKSS